MALNYSVRKGIKWESPHRGDALYSQFYLNHGIQNLGRVVNRSAFPRPRQFLVDRKHFLSLEIFLVRPK